VRTPDESDHIENAKNINWFEVLLFRCRKMDKSVPVLYIAKWRKKPKAAEKLNELGFTTIYQLEGGILKWRLRVFLNPVTKK
jgi:rhodanese-related sulfurtransferase